MVHHDARCCQHAAAMVYHRISDVTNCRYIFNGDMKPGLFNAVAGVCQSSRLDVDVDVDVGALDAAIPGD
jgi:hypothetical protein